ncbi:MAG TPA: hypothetical protein VHA06_06245 [Candidatus Angelobacter sp.]|nr:hypothetical protein [Candidatus Angelobacter sp.]
MLASEDGPWKVFARLRFFAGNGFWGTLFDCFYCVTLWIAAGVSFLFDHQWKAQLVLWLALSAGAILVERLTTPQPTALGPFYTEEEKQNVL